MKVNNCRVAIGTFQLYNIGHGLRFGNDRNFDDQHYIKLVSEFKVCRKYFIRFTSLLILAQQSTARTSDVYRIACAIYMKQ